MFASILLSSLVTTPQIMGGRTHDDENHHFYYSTVAIYSNIQCSGVLIAPKVVLTAAHCIHKGVPASQFRVAAGKSPRWQNGVGAYKVVRHENYGGNNTLRNDIGLIFLNKELPAPYKPAPVRKKRFTDNTSVWSVGFGWRGPNYGAGSFRKIITKFSGRTDGGKIVVHRKKKGQNVCSGDSGGPLFDLDKKNKVYYVLGVLSGGPPTVRGIDGSVCGPEAYYSSIMHYLDSFIIPEMRKHAPNQSLVNPSEQEPMLPEPNPEPIESDPVNIKPPPFIKIEYISGPFSPEEIDVCLSIAPMTACGADEWPIEFHETISEMLDYR